MLDLKNINTITINILELNKFIQTKLSSIYIEKIIMYNCI